MIKNRVLLPILLCLAIFLLGISGYMIIEGYTLIDAFYMTIITISTVGFSEVKPLSESGRLFTIILILIGLSSLAYAGRAVAESFFEQMLSGKNRNRKMQKNIDSLVGHYIICGFGRVGAAAAGHFSSSGVPFAILEQSEEACQLIAEEGYLFLGGDATSEKSLLAAGIKRAKGVLALLNSDPLNLFVVLTARELNPTLRIIARCAENSAKQKIIRAGADSVISPYTTAGRHFADSMLVASGHVQVTESTVCSWLPQWIIINAGSSMEGKSLAAISADMDRQIVGLRRNSQDFLAPDEDMDLVAGDEILVMEMAGEDDDDEIVAHPRKVIIIDDNPVIVRLYARLFHKAGFEPLTAFNGEDGLKLILAQKPDAAVIDFKLPGMSGIELCQEVRRLLPDHAIKLIIFTADELTQTREDALAAGADNIIIKSAESTEIIDTVVHILAP